MLAVPLRRADVLVRPDNRRRMHLLIPFAAPLSDAGQAALGTLALPRLATLLARWTEVSRDAGDERSLSPPHERALAAARGWRADDGLLPFAAEAAAADGLAPEPGEMGWAMLSPMHWQTTAEQPALADPEDLGLDDADARALFDALQPLFTDGGWTLRWGATTRWYVAHESLAALPTASLDRVAGRSVEPWLQRHAGARALRRLQAEAQMVLHTHPANAARAARGLPPVNSFWVSGTGATPPAVPEGRQAVRCDASLRGPALAEDWSAWTEAWQRLDAGPVRALLDAADAGPAVQLTLCGERSAATWAPRPRPRWRRWFGPQRADIASILAAL